MADQTHQAQQRHYTAAELGLTKAGYSIEETADIINSSRSGVYKVINDGKLKAVKNGNKTTILTPFIVEYMNELAAFPSGLGAPLKARPRARRNETEVESHSA